jgi:hypothetical protein
MGKVESGAPVLAAAMGLTTRASAASCAVNRLVRVLIGLVLLSAAALKTYQFATHPAPGVDLFTSRWFIMGAVELELVLGFLLVTHMHPRLTQRLTLLCFTVFAFIASYKAFSGQPSCGCFGRLDVSPWYALIFDLLTIVALSAFPLRASQSRSALPPLLAVFLLAFLFPLSGLSAALLITTSAPSTVNKDGDVIGSSPVVVLDPPQWLGKPFPLLKHCDIGDELRGNRWIVILYQRDCPRCRQVLSQYRPSRPDVAAPPEAARLALVEVPSAHPSDWAPPAAAGSYLPGRLDETREWFAQLPVRIDLVNGDVSSVQYLGTQ